MLLFQRSGVLDSKLGAIVIEGDSRSIVAELNILVAAVQRAVEDHFDVYATLNDEGGKEKANKYLDNINFRVDKEEEGVVGKSVDIDAKTED